MAGNKPFAANRLPVLDGLRGMAAIGVLLFHVAGIFGLNEILTRGYLFVDLFFILSGFVLTLSAEDRMNSGWGTRGFMRARLIRLWPMMVIGTAIGGAVAIITGDSSQVPLQLILGSLMIPALFTTGALFPLNGPHWSIFCELVANLAHGLVLRRLRDDMMLIVALAFACLVAMMTVKYRNNSLGPFATEWWVGVIRAGFGYTLGVWFARKYRSRPQEPNGAWPTVLFVPLLFVMLISTPMMKFMVLDIVTSLTVWPFLFWVAANAEAPATDTLGLRRIGAVSFPLYAIHYPLLELVQKYPWGEAKTLGAGVAVVLCVALAIGLARLDPRTRDLFVKHPDHRLRAA